MENLQSTNNRYNIFTKELRSVSPFKMEMIAPLSYEMIGSTHRLKRYAEVFFGGFAIDCRHASCKCLAELVHAKVAIY